MRTTLGLVVSLLLVLSACDSAADEAATRTPATSAEPVAQPAPSEPSVVYQAESTVWVRPSGSGTAIDVGNGLDGVPQHPDWSPDGTRLAFETDGGTLWTVAADGSDATKVHSCTGRCFSLQDPAWSPTGGELAFVEAQSLDGVHESRSVLRVVDIATGQVRDVATDRGGSHTLFAPRWSDDGGSLVVEEDVWASTRLDESVVLRSRVVTVSAVGHQRRALTKWRAALPGPGSPAPDSSGQLVVLVRDDNLVLIDLADGTERELTSYDALTEHAIQPTFTADGTRVVFTYVQGSFDVDDHAQGAVLDLDTGAVSMLDLPGATHVRMGPY